MKKVMAAAAPAAISTKMMASACGTPRGRWFTRVGDVLRRVFEAPWVFLGGRRAPVSLRATLPVRDAVLPVREATFPVREAVLPARDETLPVREAVLPLVRSDWVLEALLELAPLREVDCWRLELDCVEDEPPRRLLWLSPVFLVPLVPRVEPSRLGLPPERLVDLSRSYISVLQSLELVVDKLRG